MNKKEFRKYLFITSFLTAFFSISLSNSALMYDEVFVIFQIGPSFAHDPKQIFDLAIWSSITGWNSGRFISPVTHLICNLGLYLQVKTSELINIDLLTSYDLWRIILNISILAVFLKIQFSILKKLKVSRTFLQIMMTLSAVTIPITLVSNSDYSAIRNFIWSYSVITLFILIHIYFIIELTFQTGRKRRKYFYLAWMLIGISLATTYELSQVIFPVTIIIYVLIQKYSPFLNKQIKWKELFVYVISFTIPFIIIRWHGIQYCNKVGCYQSADIKINSIHAFDILDRVLTSINVIQVNHFGNLFVDLFRLNNKTTIILTVGMIYSIIFIKTMRHINFKEDTSLNWKSEMWRASGIALIPMLIIILTSFGMGTSRETQEATGNWLGMSSKDSLINNISYGLILATIMSMLIYYLSTTKKYKSNQFAIIFIAIYVFIISGFGFYVNQSVSTISSEQNGKYLLKLMAIEIQNVDRTTSGEARRCDLIKNKIKDYPEWLGHDLSLVDGLNRYMKNMNGISFCSEEVNVLFKDYKK
jgi:hypothetical protein